MPDRIRTAIWLSLILLLAVAWRIPLLQRAESFFTSDEAIVGLIARHTSINELPAFYWGQDYMGTLESYVARVLFKIGGSSVAVLKLAPFFIFVLFLLAHYDLVRLFSTRRVALFSTLLLATGPPVLLSWSIRAMAGYVETLLFGTLFLSSLVRFERTGRRNFLFLAGLSAGLGWWTCQLVACYLLGGLVFFFNEHRRCNREAITGQQLWKWLRLDHSIIRPPPALRLLLLPILFLSGFYFLLGLFVLLTGGAEVHFGRLLLKATDGWKYVRYSGFGWIAAALWAVIITRRDLIARGCRAFWACGAGFLLGYAPAIIHAWNWHEASAPHQKFSLPELLARLPILFDRIIPLILGGALPDNGETSWWITATLLGCLLPMFFFIATEKIIRLYAALAATTFALFLFSGNFLDSASYRYLIPLYPALMVLPATAFCRASSRLPAITLALLIFSIWSFQSYQYVQSLVPDRDSQKIIDWFRTRHITAGYADYWIAYRMDFLSEENPTMTPYRSQDRYPHYTQLARAVSRAGYIFKIGDPLRPAFLEAKRNQILEHAIVGRHRIYIVNQENRAALPNPISNASGQAE